MFCPISHNAGKAIAESVAGSAFANGGLCDVLGNGRANAKPLQNFSFSFLLGLSVALSLMER